MGRRANNRAVTYKIAVADHDFAFDHDVRLNDRFFTNRRLWSNYRERSDLYISADLRIWIDKSSGMNRCVRHVGCVFRGAHASRVLANASSRSRTFRRDFAWWQALHEERLFRRDAKTSTRDACAPQNACVLENLAVIGRLPL